MFYSTGIISVASKASIVNLRNKVLNLCDGIIQMIHKKHVPLKPIVSNIGSVTHEVPKELAKILKPLVDKTIYHVKNSKECADEMRNSKIEKGKCITLFDVTALFAINSSCICIRYHHREVGTRYITPK